MTTKEDVKEFLRTQFKSSWERDIFIQQIINELYNEGYDQRLKDQNIRAERRKKQIEKQNEVGEEMKKVVKPGMIVICRGTKDGIGLREVLEVDDYGINARKISHHMRGHWYRDNYITTHRWNKVRAIRDDITILK